MTWWPYLALAIVGLVGLTVSVGLTLRWRTRALREQTRRLNKEIEQRQGAEAALRRSHTHYRTVFQSAADGLVIVHQGEVREVNPAARALFREQNLVGFELDALIEWDSDQGDSWVRCRRPDGTSFQAAVSSHPFGDDARLLTISDVSGLVRAQEERRQLEKELAHGHRLEAIGRLAGGVAHDFNNMLTALAGGAEVLRKELGHRATSEEVKEVVADLEAVVRRGSHLTGQLLSFGRRQDLVTKVVDLVALVRELEPMLHRALRDDVLLKLSLPEQVLSVTVDPSQLELSLLNLVLNAGEAQPDGGEVRLVLTTAATGQVDADLPQGATGWAVLEVADDGVGIPADQQAHVFEPFFTTRAGGTGLGLAAVHGFAVQSGGWVRVESKEGDGTRLSLGLPMSVEAPDEPSDPPTPIDHTVLMGVKVLVVDDNVEVLRVMRRILQRAQFNVTATASPNEAVALCRQDVFDLLVTDVIMPELRGPELVERIRRDRPRQRVLYVSAYTDSPENGGFGDPVLHKPFTTNDLLRAVRDLLL